MLHAVSLNTTGMIQGANSPTAITVASNSAVEKTRPEHHPKPLVSVIIPCYNNGKYIEECVNSVLAQTYPNFEIIIINDASTDDSAEKIQKLKEKNPEKIQVITNNKNLERSVSRNKGIASAKGEFICILDGDDRWYPNKLATQVRAMQDDPKLAFCGTGRDFLDQDSKAKTSNLYIARSGEVFLHLLARRCSIVASSVMLRRSIVEKVGGFKTNRIPAEDFDYWVRASFLGRYKHIPEKLVSYRRHDAQSTSPNNLNVTKSIQTVTSILEENLTKQRLKEYISRVKKRGGVDTETHLYLNPNCTLKNRINIISQGLFSKFNPKAITKENIEKIRRKIMSLAYLKQAELLVNLKNFNQAKLALEKSKDADPIRIIDPNWIDFKRHVEQKLSKTLSKPSFQSLGLSRTKA